MTWSTVDPNRPDLNVLKQGCCIVGARWFMEQDVGVMALSKIYEPFCFVGFRGGDCRQGSTYQLQFVLSWRMVHG